MDESIKSKKKCFIVTPIGNVDDPIRRHIDGIINASIKPALEEKYEIFVAHEITKIGSINKQVIEHIFKSDLVIANLTNKNPNVMYELAFRHCLGKPVIQIMEEGTILPFDIGTERTIPYKNDSLGALELRDAIINFETAIDYSVTMQSPIYDILKSMMYEESILQAIDTEPMQGVDRNVLKLLLSKIEDIESKINNIVVSDTIKNKRMLPEIKMLQVDGMDKLDNDAQQKLINELFSFTSRNNLIVLQSLSLEPDGIEMVFDKFKAELSSFFFELGDVLKKYELDLITITERNTKRSHLFV